VFPFPQDMPQESATEINIFLANEVQDRSDLTAGEESIKFDSPENAKSGTRQESVGLIGCTFGQH
jgi:hypothetical protein